MSEREGSQREPEMTGRDNTGTPTNLAELVRRAGRRDPEHAVLRHGSSRMSWRELDTTVDRAAAALAGLGLAAGDRVAIQLGNTLDFPVVYFGALRAGLVAVPTNTGYTEPELAYLLADSGATALVTSSVATIEALDRLRADAPALAHVIVAAPSGPDGTVSLAPLLDGVPGEPWQPNVGGEDLAALIYTSGTSGRPRGAMLTHRALLANLDQCGQITPSVVVPDDVMLLVLPLFHVYGLNPGLGMAAWAGASVVLVDRFDPAETLALMSRHQVTNVPGAPTMYHAWAEQPEVAAAFASVRMALSGAAPLPAGTLALFADLGVRIFEGYGLTETAPVLTSTLMGGKAKPGSVGRPIPGVELVLRDENGEEVDEDDPGEIVVRGPNLFSGYWPDGREGPDADGWFGTDDVAYADDDGDLHLVDRRTELILVRGFNVYPAEVESVLGQHPAVAEVAVIGVPDTHSGEAVKAYVVLRVDRALSADELLDWAADSLARFKLPTAVEFVEALPHSATGKVSKAQLREATATS
jgi:long-chain acyl-CoA synthetase